MSYFVQISDNHEQQTNEGNTESHNHELKADKWLVFTLARIPQGMQKYIDEKCLYCSQVPQLSNFVSFSKSHFELVVRSKR